MPVAMHDATRSSLTPALLLTPAVPTHATVLHGRVSVPPAPAADATHPASSDPSS